MPWTAAEDRLCLSRYLRAADQRYDPKACLLSSRATATYHSRLRGAKVHETRGSGAYALALLDSGSPAALQQAQEIWLELTGLQDVDPDSRTYGIWSYYREEPLDRMAPPDWNWADFLGELLYQTLARHEHRLSHAPREAVRTALRHAAASIQRRDVKPGYTNICALGTFVSLCAAEYFRDAALQAYATERLRRFHADTFARGSFAEFNSPCYTIVTINALTQLRHHVAEPEAQRLSAELLRRAWQHVADHWHAPTQQWAGPHSRTYVTNLRDNKHAQAVLQKATGGSLEFFDEVTMPGDATVAMTPYEAYADGLNEALARPLPRTHLETFADGGEQTAAVVGTTWLGERATLGTVNRLDLWNQRRALLGYWGAPESGSYLQLRCLHDGRDFASAQCFTAQSEGLALALVNFGSDGGDWHPSLDRIADGRFDSTDLRVRLELAGVETDLLAGQALEPGQPLTLQLEGSTLTVNLLGGKFGGAAARVEVSALEHGLGLDLVLQQATPAATVNWASVGAAWAALAVAFDAPCDAQVSEQNQRVTVRGQHDGGILEVAAAATVRPCGAQQRAYRHRVARA